MEKRFHAVISGRVQGVSFRSFAKAVADRIGLKGFVRNMHDGRVEIVAEGKQEKLELFLQKIREGTGRSVVEKVSIEWAEARKGLREFEIIH